MSNSIKKEVEQVSKQEKDLTKLRESLKSQCFHTKKNGEVDLVRIKTEPGEPPKYICRQCQKTISIIRRDEDEIQHAVDVIDSVIDTIKISSDPTREDDEKTVSRLAKIQYRLRNELIGYYQAALKKNNRGNREDKPEREYTGGWTRPNSL